LAEIERRVGRPIAEHFDLIAGTSTGGIIAAGLALCEPAEKAVKFYRDRGPRVFQRALASGWRRRLQWFPDRLLKKQGLDWQALFNPKYDEGELVQALEEVFANRKVGDVKRCRLLIPSIDMVQGQTVVFKTPHLPGMVRDRHHRMSEVVRATTAAPTYFQPATIDGKGAYADGGVWANNPAMVAVTEAIRISQQCQRPVDPIFDISSVNCLSIGTGRCPYFANPSIPAGIAWWMSKQLVFTVMMTSQAQGVDFQVRHILGKRYRRINFDVQREWTMDNASVIPELEHLGKLKAQECLSELIDAFFTEHTIAFAPFDDIRP
jgi:hypothetical protein